MKKILLYLFFILTVQSVIQAQSKYFERVYYVQAISDARKIFLNPDGTYTIIGNTMSYPNLIGAPFYMRLNEFGDTLALRQYLYSNLNTTAWDAVQTQYGYAVAACQPQTDTSVGCRANLMRITYNGDLLNLSIAGNDTIYQSWGRSILYTPDGGYVLAGLIIPQTGSNNKLYIVKLKADGSAEWEKMYNYFPYHNSFRGILPAPEGGYYAVASIRRWAEVGVGTLQYIGDILLYKLDEDGNVEWQKIYFENGEGEQSTTFCQAPDGSLFIGGSRNFTDLVLKLDTAFNIEWSINEGNDECDPSFVGVTPDGNFLVSGCTDVPPGEADAYVKKISPTGNILWRRVYGDAGHDYFYTHLILPDGSILLGGRNDIGANAAVYIVKTNCMGLLTQPAAGFSYEPQGANEIQFTNLSLYAYPDSIDGGYYVWDFGDGSPPYLCGQGYEPCTGNQITHQYAAPGTYTATLTAIVCTDTSVVQTLVDTQGAGGTVGILPPDPLKGENTLSVYPNPAQNTLTFAINNGSKSPLGLAPSTRGDLGVRLLTLSGQTVLETTLAAGEASKTISVAHLPAGIYLCRWQQAAGGAWGYVKVVIVR
ncbi:PKD domain-containing protein [Sphingobacteriales bacterium UPWRP_1]|nr:hypothetical protein B6N25_00910 [Sphingobacteriales bacterium TSM_CSS]PSJ72432.1 PKD domain-containing protein [Sphingobacteriales bacterium UPWRP_1]